MNTKWSFRLCNRLLRGNEATSQQPKWKQKNISHAVNSEIWCRVYKILLLCIDWMVMCSFHGKCGSFLHINIQRDIIFFFRCFSLLSIQLQSNQTITDNENGQKTNETNYYYNEQIGNESYVTHHHHHSSFKHNGIIFRTFLL